ncbi:MAG: anaerobic sulfatase maturase [Clostridiales bacterium]|nr:anaerobic sulfatase maturase [Clostridiales bacterium]
MPPISIMIKPASGRCNMRCSYCFYSDETSLREVQDHGLMQQKTLDQILQKTLEQAQGSASFVFQGGEPTLRGLDFFKYAAQKQREYNSSNLKITNALQTNGLLLDEDWCVFLKREGWLVGLSVDGTAALHNRHRFDAAGQGTLARVMSAARLLQKHKVEFNVLTVVTEETVARTGMIYEFFRENKLLWQQYIPCIDSFDGEKNWLTAEGYGLFLCRLFDRWLQDILSRRFIYIRQFENYIGMLLGQAPETCGMAGLCTRQFVVEADGSVYPCDFYAMDDYYLGNFSTDSIDDMDRRRQEISFVEKSLIKDEECLNCSFYSLCRGGCRRDREDSTGMLTRTRYCSAYKVFFAHALPGLMMLADSIRKQQHI